MTYGTGTAMVIGSLRDIGAGALPAALPQGIPIPDGAVFADLIAAEDGTPVAQFDFPGTRPEANAAVAAAFEAVSGWQAVPAGSTAMLTTFRISGPGLSLTAVAIEFSFGTQWWLYLPSD